MFQPGNAEIWLTWVDVLLKFGETQNALRILKTGMKKNSDVLLKYRLVSLLLENKEEEQALAVLDDAMDQEFVQVNYLFDIYPKALKNKRLKKQVDNYRKKYM